MRTLTFSGFLSRYVRQLSGTDTTSLQKLTVVASEEMPRLAEPLLLYALYTEKQALLLQTAKDTSLYPEYHLLLNAYTRETMTEGLVSGSPLLADGYHKVWRTYLSLRDRNKADDHTKELMRQKILRLQTSSGITSYRIYTDLKLNPGNVNAWLKHGDARKVSLATARKILQYLQ